ncbi:hypothetical protein CcCBS67573_g03542 [Chytriomyces confervae]|uniref:non-specific serine/threonine protein kinase n=1 Tax=Chytriomyces confervae TaxID=246404 RepID=A0A507FIQ5_9FUNG|nr:hypothetical protein CcCBS67573_g03542 [Chytriomyces confervae]
MTSVQQSKTSSRDEGALAMTLWLRRQQGSSTRILSWKAGNDAFVVVSIAEEYFREVRLFTLVKHPKSRVSHRKKKDLPKKSVSRQQQHTSNNLKRTRAQGNSVRTDECDPADILGTVLVDPVGQHIVRIVSVIGTGSFAHVYLAESLPAASSTLPFESEKRAVKRLFKAGLDERQLVLQRQEAEVMKSMDPHPNVIQLLATVEDADCLYLIMEYCELGLITSNTADLYEAITQQGGFPEDVVKEVFVQIADAVLHCHNSGWYHRDLKPENCLISTANYKVKLADFGLTTAEEWSTELGCGSVRYMAPECFERTHNTPEGLSPGQPVPPPAKSLPVPPGVLSGGYSPAANDVWALGVILLNLLFGKNPWFEAHMTDAIFSAFAISNPNILRQQFNLTLQFDAILRRVFELDPRRRCSVQDLKLLVESVTHFVEKDTTTPALATTAKSTAHNRLKRRGHSSILAGPGYILAAGEPLPLLLSAPSAVSSPRKTPQPMLRTKDTVSNLKAAVAASSGIGAADGESPTIQSDSVAASPFSVSTHVPESVVMAASNLADSSVSALVSNDADMEDAGRMSMSSSSTMHEEDEEGDFVVTDAASDVNDIYVEVPDVVEVEQIDASQNYDEDELEVEPETDALDENQFELPQVSDSIRRAMAQGHVDRMMAEDLESVDDSLMVHRHVTDGSLMGQLSLPAEGSMLYRDSVVDSQLSADRASVSEEIAVGEATLDAVPVIASSISEQILEPALPAIIPVAHESVAPAAEPVAATPPSEATSTESSLPSPSTISPPSMERQESLINPARHSTSLEPGAAAALLAADALTTSHSSTTKRSPSPLKWFGPFISRESARVVSGTEATASAGRIGVFRIVKKKSSVLLKKPSVPANLETFPNGSSTSAVHPGHTFNILRKRRSSPTSSSIVNNKHISTATTVVNANGNGSLNHAIDETVSSLAGIEIEDAGSYLSGHGKDVVKRRSTLSMKEFSSGLKGAFGIKKRPEMVTEERT